MSCSEFENCLVDLARGLDEPEARAHAETCPHCRYRLAAETELSKSFAALRDEERFERPGPAVQQTLAAAVRRRRRRIPSPWAWAAAAAIVVGLALAAWREAAPEPATDG